MDYKTLGNAGLLVSRLCLGFQSLGLEKQAELDVSLEERQTD